MLETLAEKWVSILVSLHVVGLEGLTSASQLEEESQKCTWALVVNIGWRVEVWNSFSAELTREEILMVVHNDSNASISELVNEVFYLVKVVHVIGSWRGLYGLPHDSETNDLGTPLLHVLEVNVGDGHVKVEMILNWNVVWLLEHGVESVEDSESILLVSKGTSSCIDTPFLALG